VLGHDAVPHDERTGRGQHRQPVERPLGPELLDDADYRVRDDDPTEEGVLVRAAHQHDAQQGAHQGVEAGEDVGPEDLADGSRRCVRHRVDLAGSDPGRDLLRGESQFGIGAALGSGHGAQE